MIDCITPWNVIWNLFNPHQCSEIYELTTLTESIAIATYLPYFLKTFVLELPIYFFFLRNSKKIAEILKINSVLNVATHPIVFYIIPIILMQLNGNYLDYLMTAEIFAPLVEALILYRFYRLSPTRAASAAICANLFSWSVGVYWI